VDFHSDKSTGEVIKGVEQANSLCNLLQILVFRVLPPIIDLLLAVWYMTYMFDAYLAILVLAVGVAYLYSTFKMTGIELPLRRRFIKCAREKSRVMNEAISNWYTVAFFNRQEFEENGFCGAVMNYIRGLRSYGNIVYLGEAISGLIMTLGLLGAALMAVYKVSEGSAPVGNFIVLITLWSSISSPLASVAAYYESIAGMLIDAERLLHLLQTRPSITSKDEAPPISVSEGAVQFDHVSFSYDPRKMAISDVNFSVEAGATVALVGETGGGKTTILRLLQRFYDVSEGAVRIDGQDVRDVTLDSLREIFGVVPQDPSLFNRSILENVRYGRLDATNEDVYEACRAASVHDKILSFPNGYQSKVGERGVKLSGGELQRVAIARAIIKKPKIVLLDEATSAVDSATERTIQESFRKLSLGRTTFVVAHRLSTIMNADMILVIDSGKIVQRGTHEELLGQGGIYDKLWSQQSARLTPRTVRDRSGSTEDRTEVDQLLVDVSTETLTTQITKTGDSTGSGSPVDELDGACSSKLCDKGSGEFDDVEQGEGSSRYSDEEPSLRVLSPRPTAALDLSSGRGGDAGKAAVPGKPRDNTPVRSGASNDAESSTNK
jgi:ABC-type transport system involved in Fe-S cluster assembly fused permease/ATPase subunit